jgi:molybdopterin molybdotransferase
MISLEQAQEYVFSRISTLSIVDRDVEHAIGSVATQEIVAREDVPPYASSAMDGYAVRSADTRGAPIELRVVGTLLAGHATSTVVGPGEAMRIMTGAPMPTGADAVVRVEQTRTLGDTVTIQVDVRSGTSVRDPGEDVRRGDIVLEPGETLTPAHVGALSSLGVTRVTTYRSPRVGVLSTGDELVATDSAQRGKIRNSNGPALCGFVRELGYEPVNLGVVSDDVDLLTRAISGAVASCDAVVTTGGVSVGDADNVKVVLAQLGDARWMQVAIKPAKPLAFALVGNVPVFGLPGNPTSAMVSFELFVRPALLRMAGRRECHRVVVAAVATKGRPRARDGKTHFVWVVAHQDECGSWSVEPATTKASHGLAAVARANALAIVDDGDGAAPGDSVRTMLLTYGHMTGGSP